MPKRPDPVVTHLSRAIGIARAQRNYRLWPPMIEALPETAREPVRLWLADEARKRRAYEKMRGAASHNHHEKILRTHP